MKISRFIVLPLFALVCSAYWIGTRAFGQTAMPAPPRVVGRVRPPTPTGNPAIDAFNKGSFEELVVGDYVAANEAFSEAIKLDPNRAKSFELRATARMTTGDLDGAIADLDNVIRMAPSPIAYYNRGLVKYYKKDYKSCLGDADRVVDIDPLFNLAFGLKGDVYIHLKMYNEAEAAFTAAIGATKYYDRSSSRFLASRAYARYELGRVDGALADADYSISVGPEIALSYYVRGLLKNQAKKDGSGALDLERARKLFPKISEEYPAH